MALLLQSRAQVAAVFFFPGGFGGGELGHRGTDLYCEGHPVYSIVVFQESFPKLPVKILKFYGDLLGYQLITILDKPHFYVAMIWCGCIYTIFDSECIFKYLKWWYCTL